MLKGFTHARLACGCRVSFKEGTAGSPVTVVISRAAPGCLNPQHVASLPLYDHREALRPSTRLGPMLDADFEEEG